MSIAIKIRQARTPFWAAAKRCVKGLLHVHVPVFGLTRPFFAGLYRVHVGAREGGIWALRFFWYEPLFRSQCAAVGRAFRMEKLPYLNGKGRIIIGDRVRLSGKSSFGFAHRLDSLPVLSIGDGTFIGHDCSINVTTSLSIGKNCLLAGRVSIRDFDGHPLEAGRRRAQQPPPVEEIKPVVIGDDVWVGAGAVILKGVRIGDRAVVGAAAVVTRDVPADCVVAGNPARVVKSLVGE